MDSFLREMQREGSLDSDGVFTVDINKAKLKLAEYQISSFEMFADFLVSAATVAGVNSLDLVAEPTDAMGMGFLSTVYFRGWTLDEADLRVLDPFCSATDASRAKRYLAIALTTLSSRFPILLKSRGQGETVTLRIGKGSLNGSRAQESGFPANTTTIRVPFDLTHEIEAAFRKAREWSRVALSINRRRLEVGFATETQVPGAVGLLLASPKLLPLRLGESHLQRCLEEPEGGEALFLAFTTKEEARRVRLSFLVDGLSYPVLPELLEFGICGVVPADELKRDISYNGLLEDKAFQAQVQQTLEAVGRLMSCVLQRDARLTPEADREMRALLAHLEGRLNVSDLWAAFESISIDLRPYLQSFSFDVMLKQLPNYSQLERETLLDEYSKVFATLRAAGEAEQAARYLERKQQCLPVLPRRRAKDEMEHFLFQLSRGVFEKPPRSEEPLDRYLSLLGEWSQTNIAFEDMTSSNPFQEIVGDAQAEWFVPFAVVKGREPWDWPRAAALFASQPPAWIRLQLLLSQGEYGKALELLAADPVFRFSTQKDAWYAYLWNFHSGKMSWSTSVSVRANYSLACIGKSPTSRLASAYRSLTVERDLTGKRLEEARLELLENHYFQDTFWPRFSSLLAAAVRVRKSEDWLKQTWLMLVGQSLLDAFLEGSFEEPLLHSRLLGRQQTPRKAAKASPIR